MYIIHIVYVQISVYLYIHVYIPPRRIRRWSLLHIVYVYRYVSNLYIHVYTPHISINT